MYSEHGDVCVDTGVICVTDIENLKHEAGNAFKDVRDKRYSGFSFDVEPGTYRVDVSIPDTWNGEVEESYDIEVRSGTVVVTDPCYWFDNVDHEMWSDFLDKYEFCQRSSDEFMFVSSMGGDGTYSVSVTLTKIHFENDMTAK